MARKKLQVNILRVGGEWSKSLPGSGKKITAWCEAALAGRKTGNEVSIVLAHDAFVKELNRDYRGRNKPTNVLSFPDGEDAIGDVVLAYETIAREAKAQKKSFAAHAAHLVVHGCLHLLGHDHMRDRQAKEMERSEIKILSGFGFANPYEAT